MHVKVKYYSPPVENGIGNLFLTGLAWLDSHPALLFLCWTCHKVNDPQPKMDPRMENGKMDLL